MFEKGDKVRFKAGANLRKENTIHGGGMESWKVLAGLEEVEIYEEEDEDGIVIQVPEGEYPPLTVYEGVTWRTSVEALEYAIKEEWE